MNRGILITFEGPEGSGKSTHIRLLAAFLREQGRVVTVTREPGGTPLTGALRRLLLGAQHQIAPLAELFLYEADRAQHVTQVIAPALRHGDVVLCDRFTDSTLAYQGAGRGLAVREITQLNKIAAAGHVPALTFLLDVPIVRGLRQAEAKKGKADRLESAGRAFHQRVRRAFLQMAKASPQRFRVIFQQPDLVVTQALIRAALPSALRRRP